MAHFTGNTSSTATKAAVRVPQYIIGFELCNRHNNAITVDVGMVYGSTYKILSQKSMAADETYIYSGNKIVVPIGYELFVQASDSCDYFFTIE